MGQLQLQTRNTNLHHRTRTTITTVKMGKPSVLVVLTSASEMTGSGKPTGWYLPELAHPYYILKDKVDLTFASPKGGVAPLDQASVEMFKEDEESQRFLKDHKDLWENTKPLSNFKAADFNAIFYPGGHGPVFDLVKDPKSQELIRDFYEAGKPTAAVCHGPVVFTFVERWRSSSCWHQNLSLEFGEIWQLFLLLGQRGYWQFSTRVCHVWFHLRRKR